MVEAGLLAAFSLDSKATLRFVGAEASNQKTVTSVWNEYLLECVCNHSSNIGGHLLGSSCTFGPCVFISQDVMRAQRTISEQFHIHLH